MSITKVNAKKQKKMQKNNLFEKYKLTIHKRLKFEYGIVSKVGPFIKNIDKDYDVSIEFSEVIDFEKRIVNHSNTQSIQVNSCILYCIILGNIWTKDSIIQNITLNRVVKKNNIAITEGENYPRTLKNLLSIKNDQFNLLPFSPNTINYSMCLRFSNISMEHNKENINIIIIPCIEIIRFLFMINDSIIPIILSQGINEIGEKNEDGIIEIDGIKTAIINTFKSYKENEISMFTDILYNPELTKVYNHISAKLSQKILENKSKTAEIRTFLPSTHSNFQACGLNFNFENKEYFYVYQLLHINYRPSYDNYTYIPKTHTGKGLEVDDTNTINETRVKHTLIPDYKKNKEIDDKNKSHPLSSITNFEYKIDLTDNPWEINTPQFIPYKKIKQKHQYKIESKNHISNSIEFTLNHDIDKNSKSLLATVKTTLGEDIKEESLNIISALNLLKEENAFHITFYNLETKKYQKEPYFNVINLNVKVLICLLSKENKFISIFHFINSKFIRVVSFYKHNMFLFKGINFEEIIAYIVKTENLPTKKDFYSNKKGNDKLSYCYFERHNMGKENSENKAKHINKIFETVKKKFNIS